ncbi:MAG: hypothetical protein A3G87_06110 [Omnitrophica bacterium RIFCSPLOWO2_12_FULL_50_11]|nr:MAG: hypothetical protein A3G87_06110 [Omnitrophica bacterium RIFCSPLOWO2_12_FULL_50_11]
MTVDHRAKQELHFWDSIAINIGIVIGVGIFRVPSEVAKYIHSELLILAAWALGGVFTLLGVLCYAELSSRLPKTGGTYIYLRESFGKTVGFLFAWTDFAILRTASIAALAYIFSDYLGTLVPFSAGYSKAVAIIVIGIFTIINIAGLHWAAGVQRWLTFLKVLSVLVMTGLIFGFARSQSMPLVGAGPAAGETTTPLFKFAAAMIPVLWVYGGWHESTFLAGEFRDTKRALPISLIVGVLAVAVLYLVINAAYLQVLTPHELAQSDAVASETFGRRFGNAGQVIVTVAILISACGALNSTILTGARIPYAVAKDVPRLNRFSNVSERFGTPHASLLLIAMWSIALVVWGSFEQLLFFSGFAFWLFLSLVGLSVFRIRQETQGCEHFSMLGYPVVPVLFAIGCCCLCLVTIQHSPHQALVGTILILMGLPLYGLLRK